MEGIGSDIWDRVTIVHSKTEQLNEGTPIAQQKCLYLVPNEYFVYEIVWLITYVDFSVVMIISARGQFSMDRPFLLQSHSTQKIIQQSWDLDIYRERERDKEK